MVLTPGQALNPFGFRGKPRGINHFDVVACSEMSRQVGIISLASLDNKKRSVINKKKTKKTIFRATLVSFLAVSFLLVGDFGFRSPGTDGNFSFFQGLSLAQAAKKTKWQKILETNGVDQALWQKYLPKISRKEYNKVKKDLERQGTTSGGSGSLGPEIAVGLWYNSRDDIFKIDANKTYNIKDKNGTVIAQVAGDSMTRVKYDDDGKLEVYSSIASTLFDDNVTFDAADGDNSSIIFNVHRDVNYDGYDHFRNKIEVNWYHGDDVYNGNSSSVTQIWVINKLPLEQYVWGMGETTGTGDPDHVRVMATIFRTYGKWYIDNATKYKPMGFKIRSDSGSQIYVGSDREETYPKVREAAEETRGRIVKYKGETALTPYCSYTDGKTRKYPDSDYPYLKSVKDHKKGTKKSLKPGEGGNHMWGLSAHGALGYAEDGKSWEWILKHYYSGVDINPAY